MLNLERTNHYSIQPARLGRHARGLNADARRLRRFDSDWRRDICGGVACSHASRRGIHVRPGGGRHRF
jgi:hypothetical protein